MFFNERIFCLRGDIHSILNVFSMFRGEILSRQREAGH
ncbi:hypothetical protein I588_00880 [Enterococcus pallens ATCC BAA-351]|uniref:Uncharacterized protein n=1 Tax=Enterococcus pallens ATCC BAA-351 TaxID=1158607 RepID=R2Q9I6_9ENTE|nr:hypothetical protein UAU_02749 [Enterococcus pallens ATCC BAA-351]EOU24893.1 hypothetical protein I588_00880 [Enterococcus pallens ATCC BAA-351]